MKRKRGPWPAECTMCGERVNSADAMRKHLKDQHTKEQRSDMTRVMAEIVNDLPDGAWYQALWDMGFDPADLCEEAT